LTGNPKSSELPLAAKTPGGKIPGKPWAKNSTGKPIEKMLMASNVMAGLCPE